MNLRIVLIPFVIVWSVTIFAQSETNYLQPEYKIKLTDTIGRYIRLVNYYDRSFYVTHVYFRKRLVDGSSRYYSISIDSLTGIGVIPPSIDCMVDVQINKTLELQAVSFDEDKLTQIEIRNSGGFVILPVRRVQQFLNKLWQLS